MRLRSAAAFAVCLIVWQYGNVIGSRAASLRRRPTRPPLGSLEGRLDDAGAAGSRRRANRSGRRGPRARPAAGLGRSRRRRPPAGSPSELRDRGLRIPVDGVSPNELVRSFAIAASGIARARSDRHPRAAQHPGERRRGRHHRAAVRQQGRRYHRLPVRSDASSTATTTRTSSATRTACDEGDTVKKGQVIGYVGTSGNAPKNTPHLHFAVFRLTAEKHWWEGTPIDPYDILR